MRADSGKIAEAVVELLNKLIFFKALLHEEHDQEEKARAEEVVKQLDIKPKQVPKLIGSWNLVLNEVEHFTTLNGFINVFLINPQS